VPTVDWRTIFKIIETEILLRQHLGEHDDLASMHRDGKRNLNRFPFLCLQTA
jgi:hypothetical protein